MNTTIDLRYKYYAFISYKRADSKWADFLYKNLQSYRLPGKLCKKHSDLAKRLCPVFIDKDDLNPGNLSESLKQHIALSKFFLSVCSKNTQTTPQYIDMELQYFLETHDNDYTKVIPFIVDDAAEPEKECFSPLMQELCQKHQLVGVNVTERGKHRAFLKVVAYMHGILPNEIESADDIRRKKRTVSACFAGVLLAALAAFGLSYWWQHFAVHADYYISYVWEDNVAKGVGEIAKGDLSDYARYYRIQSVDGRVIQLSYQNYAGTLVSPADEATVLSLGASEIKFTYAASDEKYLDMAAYYDRNALPIVCYRYSADGTHVTLLHDETTAYEHGDITDVDFNFVEKSEFDKTYEMGETK